MRRSTAVVAVVDASAAVIAVADADGSGDGHGTVETSGPLGTTTTVGTARECVTVPRVGGTATITIKTVSVARAGVVVDSVVPRDSNGIRVLELSFVRRGSVGVGVFAGFPPSAEVTDVPGLAWSHRWSHRVHGTGAHLTARHLYDLVAGVELTAAHSGGFSRLDVNYHVGSRHYLLSTPAGALLDTPPADCS